MCENGVSSFHRTPPFGSESQKRAPNANLARDKLCGSGSPPTLERATGSSQRTRLTRSSEGLASKTSHKPSHVGVRRRLLAVFDEQVLP